MLIEQKSKKYLKIIQSKSKMIEYGVPENLHFKVEDQANDLIILCIAIIGDVTDEILHQNDGPILLKEDTKDKLNFAARFFDSYYQANLDHEYNDYYILMGAVAYYFCNMNGSSKVLIDTISDQFDFNASGLEKIIIWLLDDKRKFWINDISEEYRKYIIEIINYHNKFFAYEELGPNNFEIFKDYSYKFGTPREILFTDIILSIMKKKTLNSCLNLMPLFSNLTKETWRQTFINNSKIREMWLSQITIGQKNIFKGNSGVIQMPTSSGKTASVALAIQSSFLSQRTNIVVIVAPFKALCREILFDLEKFFEFDENISVTEFSDIPENSELNLLSSESSKKKIFVMTPEKLSYILKHQKDIIDCTNMIVFDEAHLFDDKSRGTDYELLLATIKHYIKKETQMLLISAVISNADELNKWINQRGVVIKNNTIKMTEKTVAFNKFFLGENNTYSNLYFVDPSNGLEEEFFVPRVVQTQELKKFRRERKKRYFPELPENKSDIAIYFSIKLVKNGSVAIFCSRKDSVNKILKKFIDLENRGISLENFTKESDINETKKIAKLIKEHLGEDSLYFAALKGIAGHHSGVPNGIKISVEYALRCSLLSCVVCTSTLAQGVNLPLKYLIISSIHQSREIIKVRDFHNLMGRTARAGKQTEGTIILTENVYKNNKNNYLFKKYINLLNPENSEECSSNLLKLVQDIIINKDIKINSKDIKILIKTRYLNQDEYTNKKKELIKIKAKDIEVEEDIRYKIKEVEKILISLENFILNFSDIADETAEIIKLTYGYYLANESEKQNLIDICEIIRENIGTIDIEDRNIFSKSMLGIMKMKELSRFISDDVLRINRYNTEDLIDLISLQLILSEDCKIIPKLRNNEFIPILLTWWLSGDAYIKIYKNSLSKGIATKQGRKYKDISLEEIISLCNYDFGYVSLSIIQSLVEILENNRCSEEVIKKLNEIINRIRYGLPNQTAINIYELGFSDRIISQKIANIIVNKDCSNKIKTRQAIKESKGEIERIIVDYPTYFIKRLQRM